MRIPRWTLVLIVAFIWAGPVAADDEGWESCKDPSTRDSYACRELIVEYKSASFDKAALAQKYALSIEGDIPQLRQVWYMAAPGVDVGQLLEELEHEQGVEEAERNGEFVSPECRQWNVGVLELGAGMSDEFHTQRALEAVHAAGTHVPAKPVLVAILDTGVSRLHTALSGRLTETGIDAIGKGADALADDLGNGSDDNHNGLVDEGIGHGTAAAGVVALLAPQARILPVKVLNDECQGTAFGFADGIVKAVDAGARVLHLGFGSRDGSWVISRAVEYAVSHGAVVVAPAGNDAEEQVQFPARAEGVIAVAAVDDLLVAPAWTNYGSEVALSAPGANVLVPYHSGGWTHMNGTSVATAFVSGAAAAALGKSPKAASAAVRNLLRDTATPVDDLNPGLAGKLGAGAPDFRSMRGGIPLRNRAGVAEAKEVEGVHSTSHHAEAGDP